MFSFGLMCLIYVLFNIVSGFESLPIYLNKLIYLYTQTLQLSIKPKSHIKISCWCISWCKHKAYRLQVYCIAQQPWVQVPLQTVAVSICCSQCFVCVLPHILPPLRHLICFHVDLCSFCLLLSFPHCVLSKILDASYFAVPYAQKLTVLLTFNIFVWQIFVICCKWKAALSL